MVCLLNQVTYMRLVWQIRCYQSNNYLNQNPLSIRISTYNIGLFEHIKQRFLEKLNEKSKSLTRRTYIVTNWLTTRIGFCLFRNFQQLLIAKGTVHYVVMINGRFSWLVVNLLFIKPFVFFLSLSYFYSPFLTLYIRHWQLKG